MVPNPAPRLAPFTLHQKLATSLLVGQCELLLKRGNLNLEETARMRHCVDETLRAFGFEPQNNVSPAEYERQELVVAQQMAAPQ